MKKVFIFALLMTLNSLAMDPVTWGPDKGSTSEEMTEDQMASEDQKLVDNLEQEMDLLALNPQTLELAENGDALALLTRVRTQVQKDKAPEAEKDFYKFLVRCDQDLECMGKLFEQRRDMVPGLACAALSKYPAFTTILQDMQNIDETNNLKKRVALKQEASTWAYQLMIHEKLESPWWIMKVLSGDKATVAQMEKALEEVTIPQTGLASFAYDLLAPAAKDEWGARRMEGLRKYNEALKIEQHCLKNRIDYQAATEAKTVNK